MRFLSSLFVRSGAVGRLRSCAHNPAHRKEVQSCSRVIRSSLTQSAAVAAPSDLDDEVRKAHEAFATMMALEKCDAFIMNPLFGSRLPYRMARGQALISYSARGRAELPQPSVRSSFSHHAASNSDSADSGSWADEFPLHRYAYLGHDEQICACLQKGADANQPDRDSWTPLHYAAWYGKLGAVQALLNYGNCNVNARNKNGSTALHFAAWCGRDYVVELLLSHPSIKINARDKDGKTPLDQCECVPKPEWQATAKLLRAAITQNLPKIQVDLLDGTNVMLSLLSGAETTTAQLTTQMSAELKLPDSCAKLFALWICSPSLELQLKADHKPMNHVQRWKSKILPKWSDSRNPESEEPRLLFRRDVRVTLAEEKRAKLTDSALALLFHEAHANYIKGLYPCSEQDVAMLAALMLQIVHGNYDSKKDKQHLANDKTLKMLLPQHKLKTKNNNLLSKIIAEHKQVTNKGAKNISGLQYQFLSFCWNLKVYGSAFFQAMTFMTKPVKGALNVDVGVNDFGLHLINRETKTLFQTYALKSLEWNYKPSNPQIEITAKSSGALHILTLSTQQANHINMLLNRLIEGSSTRSSSRSNLTDTGSK